MSQNQPAQPGKRNLLKAAAALGAAGLVGGCFSDGKKSSGSSETECNRHSEQSYPCYGSHQAGITTPHQLFGIMCAFDIIGDNVKQLENLLRTLTARIEFLTQGGEYTDGNDKLPPAGSGLLGKTFLPDGLTITVGVGSSLFDQRFGLADKKPKHLQEMRDFPNDKLQKDWCDGDLSIQICAFSPETCQAALRDILKHTAQTAIIRWSIDGFLPKSETGALAARNLLGFRDGSGNPNVADPKTADQVLWTGVAANSLDEPEWAKNGSYQAVRLIRHFVEFWDRTPLQEQNAIFGREKYSGAPLDGKKESDVADYTKDPAGNTVPTDSHMRLANPRDPEFMKKHLLFRRAFNYSRGLSKAGQLDVGLIFICYQANLADGFIFVQNLLNGEPLEEYISPFGGGYFFVLPGVEQGSFLGQGLIG
ncbi:iron uptake transporter deferrochelatase/peroxidase subunit [Neisseria sp. ZJ106]|uniref:Deferrochelatase n=1 Tax=Neisseria lisongii TaxID=2912188 RepID=A0ABY7RI78_9NEIS|nr:iron uptake transporter deferrochelatase/peroxidase subunit [Neisseria lisongii]MCF7521968.1 iron uptake transporter deferrochelatase/peroxidase subunit [Neisseria lisongii]WCL71342.1 iron uptake transporter deferrochelatase/peroxidase subunit [Neisseria lisongii]